MSKRSNAEDEPRRKAPMTPTGIFSANGRQKMDSVDGRKMVDDSRGPGPKAAPTGRDNMLRK